MGSNTQKAQGALASGPAEGRTWDHQDFSQLASVICVGFVPCILVLRRWQRWRHSGSSVTPVSRCRDDRRAPAS